MKCLFIVPAIFSIFPNSWGATAPSNIVNYSTYYTFPNSLPGTKIQITKVFDIQAGTCTFTSNSPSAKSIDDIMKMEQAETQAIRNKFGALNGSIIKSYQNLNTVDSLKVMVTLKEPEGIYYLDKTKSSQEDLIKQAHEIASIQPVQSVDAFLLRNGLKSNVISSRKGFRMNGHRKDIEKIMFDKDVASIDEIGDETPASEVIPDNILTLAPSAYWHGTSAVPSTAGAGVNASTWEIGIDPNVFNCLNSSGNLNINQLNTFNGSMLDTSWQHSQLTFHCLISAAPGASAWHRRWASFTDNPYIQNTGMQTASISIGRGDTIPYLATYPEFEDMDDHAYYWPYPVFCNPSSNFGYKYVANWQCYNAINVGNVVHSNLNHFMLDDTTNLIGGCTQTTNPNPIHGSLNDREMPSLVAPGFAHHDYCVDNASVYFTCGTSFSAPIVNGIAADVIAADSRMIGWPEKVRAVLLATAENVDRGYWITTQDGRDGAGVVHGATAVYFAQNHGEVSPNNTAVTNGIAAGSIYASDFNYPNNPIFYNIQIPNPKPAGQHLRVVLTWDSNPVLNSFTNALSDLDLMVTNGSNGAVSQSNNSNIEMVDIPITMYAAGSTAQARITKWANYIPTSGARTNYFYYSIAWTWVNDHAE